MKSVENRFLSVKHILGIALTAVMLVLSVYCPSSCGTVTSAASDKIPSIYVKRITYNPHLVQKVYLEPNTEYVFSYLYSNKPASNEKAVYATVEIDAHQYSMGQRTYSGDENRISRSFKTVSLDTEGVTEGTGNNAGKIESYVGIQLLANSGEECLNGNSLYGGFQLYKKSDKSKTNIFTDTSFSSIAWQQGANAKWTSMPPESTDFAALNFGRYDSDKSLYGTQDPDMSVYSCSVADKTVRLKNVSGKYFVQTVWLKPNTEYVFSYCYSKAPASGVAVLKNSASEYTVSSLTDDGMLKKLSCSFTTSSLQDSGVTEGTGSNSGLISTAVGLKFNSGEGYLSGGSYSDLILYEKNDSSKGNLLSDPRFDSIGVIGAATWHGALSGVNAASSVEKNTNITEDAFNKSYFVSAAASVGGRLTASPAIAFPGEKITVKPIADEGFKLIDGSVMANGMPVNAENGEYSFICPAEDTVLTAEFTDGKTTISAIRVKRTVHSPYFTQTVWLEPNTEYVLSYMYTGAPADVDCLLKAKGSNEIQFSSAGRVKDNLQRRITKIYTTGGLDDPDITVGENENAGKIKGYAGIRLYASNTAAANTYFADFQLYKKSDLQKTNLFKNLSYTSLGERDAGAVWHGAAWNTNIINNFGAATIEIANSFEQSGEYSVSTKASSDGAVFSTRSTVKSGYPLNVVGVPAEGYRLSSVSLSTGEVIEAINGAAVFTMPSGDVEVSGSFVQILKADCNGDGAVNTKDLIRIKKYVSGGYRAIVPENSDCNKDGAVNALDIAFVVKSLFGEVYGMDLIPITGGATADDFAGGAEAEASKLKAEILNAEDKLSVSGKTYYISENGNDNNDGLTENSPIKTVDKLNTIALKPGDGVFFERGSTFRLSYQYYCAEGVSYGAYGAGDKPKLYGSERDYASASLWQKTSYDNVWRTQLTKYSSDKNVYADAGIVVFNGGESVGTKQMNVNSLLGNGYFYYGISEQCVYLYCDKGNPGEAYESIEIGRRGGILKLADGVNINNLCLKYTGGHGIGGGDIENASVTDCEIGFIGGSTHYDTRYGNGIEIYNGCKNFEIRGCYVYQVFDAGITFQGDDETKEYKDITFKSNLIERCSWSIEWWSGWEKPTIYGFQICDIAPISNITFDSNIMRFEGRGWAGTTRNPASIQGPHGVKTYKNLNNFNVTGNIFDCPNGRFITWKQASVATVAEQTGYLMLGNTYYYTPTRKNEISDFGRNGIVYAENQNELETAVRLFDSEPLAVSLIK